MFWWGAGCDFPDLSDILAFGLLFCFFHTVVIISVLCCLNARALHDPYG